MARPSGRSVLAVTASSKVARVYLLLVLALLIWTAIDSYAVDHTDASFAAIFPMLATLPLSLVVFVIPDSVALYLAVIVLAALVNAALLAHLTRSRQSQPE